MTTVGSLRSTCGLAVRAGSISHLEPVDRDAKAEVERRPHLDGLRLLGHPSSVGRARRDDGVLGAAAERDAVGAARFGDGDLVGLAVVRVLQDDGRELPVGRVDGGLDRGRRGDLVADLGDRGVPLDLERLAPLQLERAAGLGSRHRRADGREADLALDLGAGWARAGPR